MKTVLIESPYAGDVERNERYARDAMRDCLIRGEAPFASHLLYTQVLNDLDLREHVVGIEAGLAWGAKAEPPDVGDAMNARAYVEALDQIVFLFCVAGIVGLVVDFVRARRP
jgi:hypothetical protein